MIGVTKDVEVEWGGEKYLNSAVKIFAAGSRLFPAGAADAGAAHPAGQGDQQHLHGAGAARQHLRHVRGLPRTPGGWPKFRKIALTDLVNSASDGC